MESVRECGENLNSLLNTYSERLEKLREKIEGAARLHHLLALKLNEDDVQMEMQKLAEKIGLSSLMQNFNKSCNGGNKKTTGKMTITTTTITTSTPKKDSPISCDSHQQLQPESLIIATSILPAIEESPEKKLSVTSSNNVAKACQEEDIDGGEMDDEEEKTATLGDSGLGTLDESFESSAAKEGEKILRACSCESIVDDATMNACDNLSQHDEDDYDTSENITSISLDEASKSESINNMNSVPLQANAHLYCHASNLQLDLDDSIIDQKTQK
jgi:hypothetical protein